MIQEQKEKILRARNYPFSIPNHSYLFHNEDIIKIIEFIPESPIKSRIELNGEESAISDYLQSLELEQQLDLVNRIPVLAYGSNASPSTLKQKFVGTEENVIIPVINARLLNFDVVYSAHISSYGSIPATLQYSPDTEVDMFVTYLSKQQLKQMHETESLGTNYCFGKLSNIELMIENKSKLNEIFTYLSLHGCLFLNESHFALSAINANKRSYPIKNENEILNLTKHALKYDKDLNQFIIENIENYKIRESRNKDLKDFSRRFLFDDWVDLGNWP